MQFDRVARVEVAPKAGGIGRRFENLRIRFSVEKDLQLSANKSKVEIYNLSPGSREAIKEHLTHIKLYAGYVENGGASLIFAGDLDYVSHVTEPPDIVTSMQVGDGRSQLRESVLSLSFPPGTKASDACRTICQQINLDVGELPETGGQLANGLAIVGSASEALRKASAAAGLDISVQDNKAQFIKRGGTRLIEVVRVSAATGLLTSPARVTRAPVQGLDTEGADFDDGLGGALGSIPLAVPQWSFKTLLNPKLIPGGEVLLESRAVKGRFKISTVKHNGDTRGPDFYSECEVDKL